MGDNPVFLTLIFVVLVLGALLAIYLPRRLRAAVPLAFVSIFLAVLAGFESESARTELLVERILRQNQRIADLIAGRTRAGPIELAIDRQTSVLTDQHALDRIATRATVLQIMGAGGFVGSLVLLFLGRRRNPT